MDSPARSCACRHSFGLSEVSRATNYFTLLTLIIGGQAAWSRDAVTAQDQTPLNFVIMLNRYYDGLYTIAPDE